MRQPPGQRVARLGRQRAEVDDRQRPPGSVGHAGRRDDLYRLTVHGTEGRAQGFVAPHDAVESGGERRRLEVAAQLDRGGDVVGRVALLHLVEEPEPLLSV